MPFPSGLRAKAFGTQRLPEIARKVGGFVREFKAAAGGLTAEFKAEIDAPAKAAPAEVASAKSESAAATAENGPVRQPSMGK